MRPGQPRSTHAHKSTGGRSGTGHRSGGHHAPENLRLLKHCADFERTLCEAKAAFEQRYGARDFRERGCFDDFIMVRTLSKGAYGTVVLASLTHVPSEGHAMKILEKRHLVKSKCVRHCLSEIRILDAVDFTFLVHLEYYFKDNVYLFLVLPFINGGDMFTLLQQLRKFDEARAKFYAAQVCLAFEYLHYMGVIYRDLKPENVLIDFEGYLKITDYGFCKKINDDRTYTLCSTPDYMAPELILSQGYNRSVDWWTFGVLIFEMCAGRAPFASENPMDQYEKILKADYQFAPHFSKPLKDIIFHFLQVDRTKRYGVHKDAMLEIKRHEWFSTIDWESVLNRRVDFTYKPKLKGAMDTSHFDVYDMFTLRKASHEEFPAEFQKIYLN